ncbi:hypothetical protein L195_g058379 [Trifolium pratense]|uniref:Uncharacterized protein n=1 Tax=Trifolium pratense TaxID=57577 RepID=A0A2K3JRX2_TRIPR|nr:hypothetical protein L195_g058379 [Trifolium pratense]
MANKVSTWTLDSFWRATASWLLSEGLWSLSEGLRIAAVATCSLSEGLATAF